MIVFLILKAGMVNPIKWPAKNHHDDLKFHADRFKFRAYDLKFYQQQFSGRQIKLVVEQ
jgi:hypothetical protein